jgi:hypothetical protein
VQEFVNVGGAYHHKRRRKDDGVWSAWYDVFDSKNILGTVSQTAGVPTGAVIENGSNANGTYTKFADGTLSCRGTRQSGQWVYPSAFSSMPNVVGIAGDHPIGAICSYGAITATDCMLAMRDTNPPAVRTGHTGLWQAIGRWF